MLWILDSHNNKVLSANKVVLKFEEESKSFTYKRKSSSPRAGTPQVTVLVLDLQLKTLFVFNCQLTEIFYFN